MERASSGSDPLPARVSPRREACIASYSVYGSLGELPERWRALAGAAVEACAGSYAPYSGLRVGAAVLLDNGEVVLGANQENAAYPSGLCAERVALFSAGARFPQACVRAIAVAAQRAERLTDNPITPCGACRQVLLESCARCDAPVPAILLSQGQVLVVDDVRSLLPLAFGTPQP